MCCLFCCIILPTNDCQAQLRSRKHRRRKRAILAESSCFSLQRTHFVLCACFRRARDRSENDA